jgi:dTDP-glucose pyrophosphorylase
LYPNSKIIETDGLTEGAACTSLLAKEFIDNNQPLLIANSDQYIDWDSAKTMYKISEKNIDGAILTFQSTHPKWSYAKVNKDNEVEQVAEKEVISNNATVGVYYWKKGKDYVRFAKEMIKKNIRINNEFYICPVYNQAILNNKKIVIEEVKKMWGLGTPEDLDFFLKHFNFKEK